MKYTKYYKKYTKNSGNRTQKIKNTHTHRTQETQREHKKRKVKNTQTYKIKSYNSSSDKSQSNLAIGSTTAHWGSDTKISPSHGGPEPLSNTMLLGTNMSVPAKWHLIPSNGFIRVHECDRQHTDRPRYGNTCRNKRHYHFSDAAQ